jgi:hypothetical protein
MRTAAELFAELEKVHAQALETEGDNLLLVRLAVVFPETAIGVSREEIDGLSVLAEAMKVGGIPVGYICVAQRSRLLVLKWSPLAEFREDAVRLERGTRFLNAISEIVEHELKLTRAAEAR